MEDNRTPERKLKDVLIKLILGIAKLCIAALMGYAVLALMQRPSPAQRKFYGADNIGNKLFLQAACGQKEMCKRYSKVFDDCAIAADVDRCINMKMKLPRASFQTCNGLGEDLSMSDEVSPNWFQCTSGKLLFFADQP